jgi:hypothetical protein
MTRTRILQMWLALAIVPLLVTNRAFAEEPPLLKDPPEKPTNGLSSYKPLKAVPKDDELRKLQVERYNAALEELQPLAQQVLKPPYPIDFVVHPQIRLVECGKRVVESGLEVFDKPQDRITLLADYVELAKEAERVCKAQFDLGRLSEDVLQHARYYRADAEIQLLKAKRAVQKEKEKPVCPARNSAIVFGNNWFSNSAFR